MSFVKVCDDDCSDVIELPLEDDGTLLLASLNIQFTQATGLKYKNTSSERFRIVRGSENCLYPPPDGWGTMTYQTVYPKSRESKRKADSLPEESLTKSCRLENKCTDLIILGLPWSCTSEQLSEHFKQFGHVSMVEIKKDIITDRPKGFGFVRFFDLESQIACLSATHEIEGRQCRVRVPNSKLRGPNNADYDLSRRVFVGRVNQSLGREEIENYFSRFGRVTDVFVPDPFRSFVFVTFSDPRVAAELVGQDLVINNCSVHISTAVPRDRKRLPDSYFFSPIRPRSFYYDQMFRRFPHEESPLDIGSLNIGVPSAQRPVYHHPPFYRPFSHTPSTFDYSMYRSYGHHYSDPYGMTRSRPEFYPVMDQNMVYGREESNFELPN